MKNLTADKVLKKTFEYLDQILHEKKREEEKKSKEQQKKRIFQQITRKEKEKS